MKALATLSPWVGLRRAGVAHGLILEKSAIAPFAHVAPKARRVGLMYEKGPFDTEGTTSVSASLWLQSRYRDLGTALTPRRGRQFIKRIVRAIVGGRWLCLVT